MRRGTWKVRWPACTWLVSAAIVLFAGWPAWASPATAKAGSAASGPNAAVSSENPPAHPVTVAQVYRILELTGANTLRREMLDGMLPHLKEMMPYMPQDVILDIQRSLGSADYEGAMVRAFQQRLSTEDAAAMIAFYESPAGRHVVAVMPRVLDESRDDAAELGQQVMIEVIRRHKDEIDAAARLYRDEHPQPAPGVGPQN